MARLSSFEFHELMHELVKAEGIAKLQEKLLRSHVLVSRRRIGTVDALARQLYQLTLGLDREGIASQVLITLWEELLRENISEEAAKQLEDIAEKINRCLDPGNVIEPGKKDALRDAVAEYRAVLRERVGDAAARLTMVMRALPSVVAIVREDTQGS